jgi:hypothetical protein
MTALLVRALLRLLFLPEPPFVKDDRKIRQFEGLTSSMLVHPEQAIDYDLPYAKHEFLQYLAQTRRVLFHGSSDLNLDRLEPQPTTDFNGKALNGLLATSDPIWSIFFAVLDWQRCRGSVRNGGFATGGELGSRYYFFSVDRDSLRGHPWTEGMVYILPKEPFIPTSRGAVRFDEWASVTSVAPVGKILVSPLDFPFLDQVTGHPDSEPVYLSWLLYKMRQRRVR